VLIRPEPPGQRQRAFFSKIKRTPLGIVNHISGKKTKITWRLDRQVIFY
jgi:hypothetical protein